MVALNHNIKVNRWVSFGGKVGFKQAANLVNILEVLNVQPLSRRPKKGGKTSRKAVKCNVFIRVTIWG